MRKNLTHAKSYRAVANSGNTLQPTGNISLKSRSAVVQGEFNPLAKLYIAGEEHLHKEDVAQDQAVKVHFGEKLNFWTESEFPYIGEEEKPVTEAMLDKESKEYSPADAHFAKMVYYLTDLLNCCEVFLHEKEETTQQQLELQEYLLSEMEDFVDLIDSEFYAIKARFGGKSQRQPNRKVDAILEENSLDRLTASFALLYSFVLPDGKAISLRVRVNEESLIASEGSQKEEGIQSLKSKTVNQAYLLKYVENVRRYAFNFYKEVRKLKNFTALEEGLLNFREINSKDSWERTPDYFADIAGELSGDSLQENIDSAENKDAQFSLIKVRSLFMHWAANQSPLKGLWKVGDSHVEDIEGITEPRNYDLLSRSRYIEKRFWNWPQRAWGDGLRTKSKKLSRFAPGEG